MTDQPTGKVELYDLNAEQCVLGAMLQSADAIADVSDILRPLDFYNPRHARIYRTAVTLYGQGEPVDAVTVADRLEHEGELMRVGGGPYLLELIHAVPTPANGGWYARIVKQRAVRRNLDAAAVAIHQLVVTASDIVEDELPDMAGKLLYDAVGDRASSDMAVAGDLVDSIFAEIEEAGTRTGLLGLSTGLIDLDHLTHGLQPGQLWIPAGRPGMGKTIWALDVARAVALRQARPVLFISLEMGRSEIMRRLLSAETGVRHDRILNGQLSDAEWTALARAGGVLADAPLHIHDGGATTLTHVRTTARRLAQRQPLGLLVVDYLQLMSGPTSGRRPESREREVADISRGLKALSRELDVPIIAVSQLNRGPEQRTDKRPQLADLRESGAVEQDADVVILLHREDYYERRGKESHRRGEVDLIVAKNRHGRTGEVVAAAQMQCMRFADLHPEAA